MSDKGLIQSYVHHEDKSFFVSTIDRNSSSTQGGRYAETIVWEWDSLERKRGSILYQGGAGEGSIRTHQAMCLELFKTGLIANDHD